MIHSVCTPSGLHGWTDKHRLILPSTRAFSILFIIAVTFLPSWSWTGSSANAQVAYFIFEGRVQDSLGKTYPPSGCDTQYKSIRRTQCVPRPIVILFTAWSGCLLHVLRGLLSPSQDTAKITRDTWLVNRERSNFASSINLFKIILTNMCSTSTAMFCLNHHRTFALNNTVLTKKTPLSSTDVFFPMLTHLLLKQTGGFISN